MRQRRPQINLAARFFLLFALISCLSVITIFRLGAMAEGDLGPGAADLNPLERYGLRIYLRAQTAALQTPAGANATPVEFSVISGETASQVAIRLAALGLVQWLVLRVRERYLAIMLGAMFLVAAKLAACVVARIVYGPDFLAQGYVAGDWETAKLMITLFWTLTVLCSVAGLIASDRKFRRTSP